MKKRLLFSVCSLLMVLCILFAGCEEKETRKTSSTNSNTTGTSQNQNVTDKDKGKTDNQNTDGKQNEKKSGTYVRAKAKPAEYQPVYSTSTNSTNKTKMDYDIKVTTFNVGGFYHGVDMGMHAEGQFAEWVPNNYNKWMHDIARFDSDIYAFQEFSPLFYESTAKNVKLTSKEVFSNIFKTLNVFEGSTKSGILPMYNALATQNTSKYSVTNVKGGHLSAKNPDEQRTYIKGYVNIGGAKVAVYSVHLGLTFSSVYKDSVNELIAMMQKEEYCIVMGDTNSNNIAAIMKKAGMNVANMDKFGNFGTYEYNESQYIDNIFTTPNIEIKSVVCEKDKCGGSDHYPLSAYLKIKQNCKNEYKQIRSDSDGYADGWYKP